MHDTFVNTDLAGLRILLWDIDGTLLRSKVQGGYLKYFAATMRKVYGSAGVLEEIVPSGMTDTQIIYEALRDEGFAPDQIFAAKELLLETFAQEMRAVLADGGEPYETLPGVTEILRATAADRRFYNALLTGNLSVAARIKLESVGLWHYFAGAPNAFGEISHERTALGKAAEILFEERFDYRFAPEQFVIVGDTPNDIHAARAFGAKVVAVATGRRQLREELVSLEPDHLLEDLSDTERVLEILREI